jgi:carboxypeptidase family protein
VNARAARLALGLCVALALTAYGRSTRAQVPAKPSRFATIVGAVDDSLRRGPLANATVIVLGTERRTTTDARGVFTLDSLEPGELRLGIRHPLLDTLGLPILSDKVQITAGQRLEVVVQTATFASLRDRVCPRGGVISGPAMIFGRVLEADTDAPIQGASVSLVYRDLEIGDGRERVRQGRMRDDGSFVICGLPENIAGTVQAQRAAETTAELPVILRNDQLGTAILTMSLSNERLAAVQGRVTNKAGEPVEGAQVAVAGTATLGLTKADGTFSLSGLPSGTVEVVVRKLGLAQSTRAVPLTKREPRRLNVVMDAVQVLAAIKIEGKLDAGLQKAGFLDRKKMGNGQFISPDDIARRKPEYFTDLMQTMSGFRVVEANGGRVVQATRSTGGAGDGCVNVFIDRSPFQVMSPGDLDAVLRLADLGAVEAYPSATDTPAEFQVTGRGCATLVVWTKTRLGRP